MAKLSRKKRRQRNLIFLLVLLVLLGGSLLAVNLFSENEEGGIAEEEGTYNMLDGSDIQTFSKFHFTTEDKTFTFYLNKDDTWVYEQDELFPVSKDAMTEMIAAAGTVTSEHILKDGAKNPKKYGIDQPKLDLTVTADKKNYHFVVGNYNNTAGMYYLQYNDGDDLYLIDDTLLVDFNSDLYSYGAVETIPGITQENITNIDYYNDKGKITIEHLDDYGLDMTGASTWYFHKPFHELRGIDPGAIEDFIGYYTGMTLYRLADYNVGSKDLDQYHLTNEKAHRVVISYSNDDSENKRKYTIYFGKQDDESGYYYVRITDGLGVDITDSKCVYLVDPETVNNCLNINPATIMFGNVNYVKSVNLEKATITVDGESYELVVDRSQVPEEEETTTATYNGTSITTVDTKGYIYYLNGKKMEEEDFKKFYKELVGLQAESIFYNESEVKQDSEVYMTIEFESNAPGFEHFTVNYAAYNAGYYEAGFNKDYELLVNKSEVDAVVETLKELAAK